MDPLQLSPILGEKINLSNTIIGYKVNLAEKRMIISIKAKHPKILDGQTFIDKYRVNAHKLLRNDI